MWNAYARLCSRLPWVTITPLGLAVDPEVYCRNAVVLRPTAGSRQAAPPSGISSLAITSTPGGKDTRLAVSLVVSTADGSASSWIAASRASRCEPERTTERPPPGGHAGTATTFANRQAKNAPMKSSPGG